ncbi:phage holin family protein [Escherichia coli]|nr:hypothetical protein [Escherichia coli]EEQ8120654.1 hypothetical protein [Escherichia coli]EHR9015164.1 phage holin family protein [Escherichia coli]
MDYIIVMLASAANMSALMYMMLYTRNGATFKLHISSLAWLLMAATVFNLFRIWTDVGNICPMTRTEVIWQLLLFIPVILYKGNVSFLIPKEGYHENIRKRA